jgi:hypothetical protein
MSDRAQMIVRIVANAAELKKALAEGTSGIVTTTAAMQKLASSLDGSKLIQRAHNIVAAINEIGGASKLTSEEASRQLATIDRAMEKLSLSSKPIPQDMVNTANALRGVVDASKPIPVTTSWFGDLAGQVKATALGFVSAQAVIGVVQTGFRLLTQFVGDSVEAYAASEASSKKLTTALRLQGPAAQAARDDYDALAKQFQRTTVFEDDLISSMQTLLVQVGNVMPSQMGRALTAATDLASGLGIDLEQATTLVAKAFAGNTESLGRYGINIDEARFKTEGATYVLDEIQKRFGGQAQAELDTYAGKVKQMANAWGDVKEGIGRLIVEDPVLKAALELTNRALTDQETATNGASNAWGVWAGLLPQSVQAFRGAREELEPYAELINTIAESTRMVAAIPPPKPVTFNVGRQNQFGPSDADVQKIIQNLKDTDEAQKKAAAAAESHAKALADVRRKIADATRDTGNLTAAQIASVKSYEDVGLTAHEMGLAIGVSELAIKKYQDGQKDSADVAKQWGDVQKSMAEQTRVAVSNLTKQLESEWKKEAEARASSLVRQLATHREVTEQVRQLGMSATEKRLSDIDRELQAKLRALATEANQDNAYISDIRDGYEALAQHQRDLVTGTADTIVERMRNAGVQTRADLAQTAANARRDYDQMVAAGGVFSEKTIKHYKKVAEEAERAAEGTTSSWDRTYSAFGDVATILDAIPGKVAEIGAMAARAGQAVMKNLADGNVWGAVIAGATAAVGILTKLFGVSQKELEGRKVVADMEKQLQSMLTTAQKTAAGNDSWKMTTIAVRDAYLAAGRTAAEAEVAVAKLWASSKGGAEAAKAAADEINAVIGDQAGPWARAEEAIQKYGFSFDELGSKIQASRLLETGKELLADFQALTFVGVDTNAIIERMSGSVSDFVQKAMATGTEIPAAMRPMLEQMLEAGKLIDSNGNALQDLEGLTFATTLTEGFKQVTDAIYAVRDALVGGVGGAIDDLGKRKVVIPVEYDYRGGEIQEGAETLHRGIAYVRKHHQGVSNVLPFRPPVIAHKGLLPDEVPAILQTGEAVLNRRAVASMGTEQISALNGGGSMGGDVMVDVHNYVTVNQDGQVLEHRIERKVRRMAVTGELRPRAAAGRGY